MGNLFHYLKIYTLKNYQNAQIIHIGIREGKEVIKQEIDIDTEIETGEGKAEVLLPSDIFKVKIRKNQLLPIKPIIEGEFQ